MNSGVATSLIPPNQLAFALNTTERGGYATNRPALRKIALDFASDEVLERHFQQGKFQGAGVYESDSGRGSLLASIAGRLFNLPIGLSTSVVQEVTVSATTVTTAGFIVPTINGVVTVTVSSTANIPVGEEILIGTKNYVVVSIISPTQLIVKNIDDTPAAAIPAGAILTFYDLNPATPDQAWIFQGEKWSIVNDGQSIPIIFDGASAYRSPQGGAKPGISAGKMGAYWQGRFWWVNPDGRSYRAGDLVYSSSGTLPDRRDAILYQKDNTFLNTGGNFTIPANAGQITAMRPVNVLDNSLGQGPMQVCTAVMIFGNSASADSATWQTTNSTIQGVSLIDAGPLGQNSTILVNGDMFYRSIKGFNTLLMARREFNSWGNTPISQELNRVLVEDDVTLLQFGSGVVFDNRVLETVGPVANPRGVYHKGLAACDFDVISSMRDKKPSVWDSIWTGMRVLQILVGRFDGVERCFAFSLTEGGLIELWEVLNTGKADFDQDETPIVWTIETAECFRSTGIGVFQKSRLMDGEMYIDELVGYANVQVFFKPDQASCWIPWTQFDVCAKTCALADNPFDCLSQTNFPPQFRNRLGFGEPTEDCNPNTECPWREAWTFRVKLVITGSLRIKGLKFKAVKVDEPELAPPMCQFPCEQINYASIEVSAACGEGSIGLVNNGASLGKGAHIVGSSLVLPAGAFTSRISQDTADTAAQNYIDALLAANLAAGKLLCVDYSWELCSGTTNEEGGGLVEWSNCEGAPATFSYGASGLAPVLNDILGDCGAGPVNFYSCIDVTVQTTEIGPFAQDQVITVNGLYQVDMTHYPANPCGDQGSVSISAYLANPSQFGDLFSINFQMTDVPTAGVFTIVGTLTAGLTARVVLVTTADVQGDPAINAPPVIQLAVSSVAIT